MVFFSLIQNIISLFIPNNYNYFLSLFNLNTGDTGWLELRSLEILDLSK